MSDVKIMMARPASEMSLAMFTIGRLFEVLALLKASEDMTERRQIQEIAENLFEETKACMMGAAQSIKEVETYYHKLRLRPVP